MAAINREFAYTTDQSCLKRWLTEAEWDVEALNKRRLKELQKDPATQYSAQGVIALDNVLIDHHGKRIVDVGYFWDHAEQRHKIAHDYLIADYVFTSGSTTRSNSDDLSNASDAKNGAWSFKTITCCSANWLTGRFVARFPETLVVFSVGIDAAGEARSASTGTASSTWVWVTVSWGKAWGRPATCTWSSWRTACSCVSCGRARASGWALERLATVGQACRAVARETLSPTISWVIDRVQEDGWKPQRVVARLKLT